MNASDWVNVHTILFTADVH